MRLNTRPSFPGLGLGLRLRTAGGGGAWTPADLTGVYAAYDFTDASTLWQNTGRTTSVTTLGQPIAVADDVSGNSRHAIQAALVNQLSWSGVPATYGPELVTNGGFATDSDWTKGTGVTIGSGVATWTSVAGNVVGLSQPISVTANKLYEITYTISSKTAGGVRARFSGGTIIGSATRNGAAGTYTQYLRAVTGNNALEFFSVGTTSLAIDNVTVREVLTASGSYGALFASSEAAMSESGSTTLGTPVYIAAAVRRFDVDATGIVGFGSSGSQYYRIQAGGTAAVGANSVVTGPGSATANSAADAFPVGATRVVEGIFQSGTQLVGVNGVDVSAANSITTQTFTAKAGLYGGGYFTSISIPVLIYALVQSTALPTAGERARVRAWLADKGGVTL